MLRGRPQLYALRVPLRTHAALERLTGAERDVLLWLSRGGSNERVARARGVAVRTLCQQVASIFDKLGVHSRAELAWILADVDLGSAGVLHRSAPRRAMQDRVPNVLVAEDHAPLLEELATDLELAGMLVECARSLEEVRRALHASRFDAAVLDIRLGSDSALDVLRDASPTCPVVLLSNVADLEEAIEGLMLGAYEFVDKSAGPEVLRVAIADAITSGPALTPAPPPIGPLLVVSPDEEARVIVEGLLEGRLRFAGTLDYSARHHLFAAQAGAPLNNRQRLVVGRLACDVSQREIAAELGISNATLVNDISRALDALGVRDRGSLIGILAPITHLWPQ